MSLSSDASMIWIELISLLLLFALATTATTLLLFALRPSNFSKFNELLDLHFLFDRRLNNVLFPFFLNLSFSEFFSLLLHPHFFSFRLFLQILGLQVFVFIPHQFALPPLFKPFRVIERLVLLKSLLYSTSLSSYAKRCLHLIEWSCWNQLPNQWGFCFSQAYFWSQRRLAVRVYYCQGWAKSAFCLLRDLKSTQSRLGSLRRLPSTSCSPNPKTAASCWFARLYRTLLLT